MIEIWVLGILFIILLILPIVIANLYYRIKDGEVLFIKQDRVRDGRYFGKSFSSLIKKGLQNIERNEVYLSKREEFINGDKEEICEDVVDELVIFRQKDFIALDGTIFKKEVYSEQDICIEDNVKLRALYSDKNIIVGKGSQIMRWIDAEGTVAIYDRCNLGISASSGSRMSIGENCIFQRLYAKEIYIGQYPGELLDATKGKNPRIYRLPVQTAKEKNIRYISNEMVNDEGIVDYSILSWKNLSVTENIIVKGDIRSGKGVRLFDGAVVVGNVFAEGDIILGKNSCVLGNVFSQENIYLEKGAVVGKKGSISSIIARGTITLEPGTFVFGYLSCERGGKIISSNNKPPKEYKYLEEEEDEKILRFKDLKDYEGIDQQGYRFHKDLEEVIIPEGAKKIQKSMFFKCTSLKRVYIPDSIEEIEDFAFADCEKLKEISLKGKHQLKKIGISAFENCKSLESVEIPETVEILEAASFAGCTSLKSLSFHEDCNLNIIEDHCFRGCTSLKKVIFTSHIEKISHTAFKDCENLEEIQFPEESTI